MRRLGVWTGRFLPFEHAMRTLYHPEWITAPVISTGTKWHYIYDEDGEFFGSAGVRVGGWRRSPWFKGELHMAEVLTRLNEAGMRPFLPERAAPDNGSSLRTMCDIGYGFMHAARDGMVVGAHGKGDAPRLATLALIALSSRRYLLIKKRAMFRLPALDEREAMPPPENLRWI